MKKIYLDNASNTPIRHEVLHYMYNFMKKYNGHPYSHHKFGRLMRYKIEMSRILISNIFNVDPYEIFFTAGGAEANNFILNYSIKYLNVKRIITSKLEHNSILKYVNYLYKKKLIILDYINIKKNGIIDLEDLDKKLYQSKSNITTLVSLMYANNEIGNIIDIESVINICKKYQVYFHSDCVQGIGYYNINIGKLQLDFISASAHKFNGPIGIGFVIIKKNIQLKNLYNNPSYKLIIENKNIYGIIGMAKALELAYKYLNQNTKKIKNIKSYCISNIKKNIPQIKFIGLSNDMEKSIYTILNIIIPIYDEMIIFKLDLEGIAVSQGSACMDIKKKSHVIQNLYKAEYISNIRISFGIYNTTKDIDKLVFILKKIIYNNKI